MSLSTLADYATRADLRPRDRLACAFDGCARQHKSYHALTKHIQGDHEIDVAELHAHWLHAEAVRERAISRKRFVNHSLELSEAELAHARPWLCEDGSVDEYKVYCLKCKSNKRVWAKRGYAAHVASDHNADATEWLCVSDGALLKNNKPSSVHYRSHSRFTRAIEDLSWDRDLRVEAEAPPTPTELHQLDEPNRSALPDAPPAPASPHQLNDPHLSESLHCASSDALQDGACDGAALPRDTGDGQRHEENERVGGVDLALLSESASELHKLQISITRLADLSNQLAHSDAAAQLNQRELAWIKSAVDVASDHFESLLKKIHEVDNEPTRHVADERSGSLSTSQKLLASLEARAIAELDNGDMDAFERVFNYAEKLRGQLSQPSGCVQERHHPAPQPQPQGQAPHGELMKEIIKLQQGGDSVPVPQVRIAQHALDFDGEKKSRTGWPFGAVPDTIIPGFREYMVPLRVNADTFRESQAMGIKYLFNLLDIDKSNYSDIGLVQALHDQGVLGELVKLRILDTCFSWTLKIMSALKHCIAFMLIQCEQNGFGPARKALSLLRDKTIADTLKACQDKRKEATQARKELEIERLKNYMTREEARSTLSESMADLHAVCRIHEGADALSSFWQRVASINMAWQLTIPGAFGRGGELEGLYESEVVESRKAGKAHVLISRHKTVKKRGKLGRHFTSAMWKGVDHYVSLPPLEGSSSTSDNKPFLRPAKPHMKTAGLYNLLKAGGRVFIPWRTFPRTNLQRKWITSAVRKDENVEKCKEWVAEYNAHLLTTGDSIYHVQGPEDQAAKAKAMMNAFFGSEMEWPSGDQLPQETIEEATARLKEKYGRCACEGDDNDSKSDSDCDSDGDERHVDIKKVKKSLAAARKAKGKRQAMLFTAGNPSVPTPANDAALDTICRDPLAQACGSSGPLPRDINKCDREPHAAACDTERNAELSSDDEDSGPRFADRAHNNEGRGDPGVDATDEDIQPLIDKALDGKRKGEPKCGAGLKRQKAVASGELNVEVSESDQQAILHCQTTSRVRHHYPLIGSEMRFLVYKYRLSHGQDSVTQPDIREVRRILAEGTSKRVNALSIGIDEDQVRGFFRTFLKQLAQPPSTE